MESLLEKISSYNILNNLIPGAVFVFLGKLLDIISLPLDGIVESIFIYYFCGMIISRIGSLVIEGIFERLKWIKYASKAEYVAAVKKDARIESLLETSNMYRTCASLFSYIRICERVFGPCETAYNPQMCNDLSGCDWLVYSFFHIFCKADKTYCK